MMTPLTRDRFIPSLLFLAAVACCIGSCASPDARRQYFYEEAIGSTLQWPPPPQKPRVLFAGMIKEPRAPERGGSWTAKFMRGIFGPDGDLPLLVRPYGVYADTDRVYVTDPGAGILHIFDRTDNTYRAVDGAGEEELVSPIGIAVDRDGFLYVSDSVLRKVFVFDRQGAYKGSLGSSDIFKRPAGIALRGETIYVVDTHDHRVIVLSTLDGRVLFRFGGQGTGQGAFNYPTNIFAGKDDLIYIVDSMNFRVQVFTPEGNFVSSFGKAGDGSGDFSKPKGIAVDSTGNIYVADAHFDTIQIFGRSGELLLIVGNSGNREGEFSLPSGLYIDSRDRIYVADSLNRRIQILQFVKDETPSVAR